MLGDSIDDFYIPVTELVKMVQELDTPARMEMTVRMHAYLEREHYGFTDRNNAKYSWPYLARLVEKTETPN